jgi:hypothetical protein
VGKPHGKSPLGNPRRRWKDKIKVDLNGLDLSGSGKGQRLDSCEFGNELPGSM